ncbi:YtkA-like protein [Tumebacillus sp. BK434]|uniref:FixH family protein n=1 Tax=Tumebacillus sp. BK434 TaxID=2512169 RepID=UPI001045C31E|nr:FixH family protein [Tumebacillus sp. BK434]TCP58001.1 YtkA-like protein [Tumebacillus sp. BK434]
MKRIAWIAALLTAAALATAGCGTDGGTDHAQHGTGTTKPQKLNIEFTTTPSPAKAGAEAELVATIARAGEPVTDAKVEFEIWQGEGAHETLNVKGGNDGRYALKKTFTTPGTYQVTIHTTTKELHQMPTVSFEVVQ